MEENKKDMKTMKKTKHEIGMDPKTLEVIEETNKNFKEIQKLLKLNHMLLSKIFHGPLKAI